MEATELAETWSGKTVTIRGCGGMIRVTDEGTQNSAVSTVGGWDADNPSQLLVERLSDDSVAFRVSGTDLYLTNIMYGDKERQSMAETLVDCPDILTDTIETIVEYAVGQPTDTSNFEGAGFNYSPMMAQQGPPNKLQTFQLEHVVGRGKNHLGVRSMFGTYWRSQHWNSTVSQSPHLLGDESWYFQASK